MNPTKILTLSIVSGVMMSVAAFFVLANAHIDIFPCQETVRELDSGNPWSEGRLVTKEGTCSLMDQLRDDQFDPEEKTELTGLGWVMLVSLGLGVGIADALVMHTVLAKAAAKKRA